MNPIVQDYVNKKMQEINQEKHEAKNEILISEGLFEKTYSPKNEYSKEFRFSEVDPVTKKNRWYKKIPIEVTDEEFKLIEKIYKKTNKNSEANYNIPPNKIAIALRVIAYIIFIVGIIVGLNLLNEDISYGLAGWLTAFILGTVFLGFSETIRLLQDIKYKNNM